MRTQKDVPAHIVAALEPIGEFFDLYMSGDDLIIENASDWDFSEMTAVAEALGIKDLDIESGENGKVENEGGGCPSCGFGARLRVHGAGKMPTPAAARHARMRPCHSRRTSTI